MEKIRDVLNREKPLSIRQLSIITNAQWVTVRKSTQGIAVFWYCQRKSCSGGQEENTTVFFNKIVLFWAFDFSFFQSVLNNVSPICFNASYPRNSRPFMHSQAQHKERKDL